MKSKYKKLGNYIQIVNKRDTDKTVDRLLGVSIRKVLIPSIANIVGTDMSTYKIIQKNQFAYGPVTSRNGDKISVALLDEYEEAIVSQAYTVFEVIDKNELLPEYLMMWFRRPEFDRYARFKSHGSAREIFGWDEMCDTELPIPSIEKQQEIVKEYHVLVDRIALNNQLISKLEETAQAIYKHWFVDFEFPDEKSLPFKSNSGKMVWCEELEKGIPEGWKLKKIKEFGKTVTGKTPSSNNPEDFGDLMPFITPGDFKKFVKFSTKADRMLSNLGVNNLKNKILPKDSIIVTCIGSDMGKVVVTTEDCITNQQMNSIIINEKYLSDYLYYTLKNMSSDLKSIAVGSSTMPMLNKSDFDIVVCIYPDDNILKRFAKVNFPLNKLNLELSKSVLLLEELRELLLAKMTKVGTENILL
jgi:type I restriction enzyme S subunit